MLHLDEYVNNIIVLLLFCMFFSVCFDCNISIVLITGRIMGSTALLYYKILPTILYIIVISFVFKKIDVLGGYTN